MVAACFSLFFDDPVRKLGIVIWACASTEFVILTFFEKRG
jgi:hypothetical protein